MTTTAPAQTSASFPGTGSPGQPEESPSTGSRPGSNRRFLVVLALVVIATITLMVLARDASSTIPLAPDNPEPGGAQALATILEEQGVTVHQAWTTQQAIDAAGPGSTLLIAATHRLEEIQLRALRETGADIVLTQFTFHPDLSALTERVAPDPAGSPDPLTAQCTDPHAQAADTISRSTGAVRALDTDVELCFPTSDGAGALATWQEDGRRWAALADAELLSNEHLADHGNAALALRLLGGQEDLVWYLPSVTDSFADQTGDEDPSTTDLIPPTATMVGLQLVVLIAVVILWAGRRLGRVVTEPMPVVVRSAETVLGRGRLYRRARDYGHAAGGLRGGTAARIAARLGLAHSSSADELVAAIARATGRDEPWLRALLYGPSPASDAELLALTRELDALESEVHRT